MAVSLKELPVHFCRKDDLVFYGQNGYIEDFLKKEGVFESTTQVGALSSLGLMRITSWERFCVSPLSRYSFGRIEKEFAVAARVSGVFV